tara:strand:+ start:5147 stop:6589 length:1443 start_codon:yes stop_codon:yes gene_type:complete
MKNQFFKPGTFVIFFTLIALMTGIGVQLATLVLYFVKHLQVTDGQAYGITAVFEAIRYLTGVLGGYLGGRLLKHMHASWVGIAFIIIGLLGLASQQLQLIYLGLACSSLGYGLVLPNVFYVLGQLYPLHDERRDSMYTIAYTSMNIGAFMGLGVLGYFSHYVGFSLTYLLAAGVLVICLVLMIVARHYLVFAQEQVSRRQYQKAGMILAATILIIYLLNQFAHSNVAMLEILIIPAILVIMLIAYQQRLMAAKQKLMLLALLLVFSMVFWILYNMQYMAITLFMDRNVDRHLFGVLIPAQAMVAFNPIYMLVIGPLLSVFWLWLRKRGTPWGAPTKFALALMFISIGFLLLALGIYCVDANGLVNIAWLLGFFLLLSLGEMTLSPTGFALVGELADQKWQSLLLGVWQLSLGCGGAFAGGISQLTSMPHSLEPRLTNPSYQHLFVWIAIMGIVAATIVFSLRGIYRRYTLGQATAVSNRA